MILIRKLIEPLLYILLLLFISFAIYAFLDSRQTNRDTRAKLNQFQAETALAVEQVKQDHKDQAKAHNIQADRTECLIRLLLGKEFTDEQVEGCEKQKEVSQVEPETPSLTQPQPATEAERPEEPQASQPNLIQRIMDGIRQVIERIF